MVNKNCIIEPKNTPDLFERVFCDLKKKFDCTYMFYQYSYHDFKLSFSTNTEWMDEYVGHLLIDKCPLIRMGLQKISSSKTSAILLRWNDILPISKDEKNTVGIRAEFNICNGISFARKLFSSTEYFGMAADAKHNHFSRNIILDSQYVKELMNQLRCASINNLMYSSMLDFGQSCPKSNINNMLGNKITLLEHVVDRVGGASRPRPLTPPYVRCRIL